MFTDLIVQFILECSRALLVDELSERVRNKTSRIVRARRNRRRVRIRSRRAAMLIRGLSTESRLNVE